MHIIRGGDVPRGSTDFMHQEAPMAGRKRDNKRDMIAPVTETKGTAD